MHNQAFYFMLLKTEMEVQRLDAGGRFQPEAKWRRLAPACKPGPPHMPLMGRLVLLAVSCFSSPLSVHHSVGWCLCFPFSQAKAARRRIYRCN